MVCTVKVGCSRSSWNRPVAFSPSVPRASATTSSSGLGSSSASSSLATSLSIMSSSGAIRLPDQIMIQRLAGSALQTQVVEVEKLDSYLYRTFRLRTRQSFFYLLRCTPSRSVRLLRHEEGRIEAEATILQLLSGQSGILNARLVDYDSTKLNGSPHLICGPFSGSILSDIEPSLSKDSLAAIDQSLGQCLRCISELRGQAFGPFQRSQRPIAHNSWAQQFSAMLETVLRDGEDALISLPYAGIRTLIHKHKASLDRIIIPRVLLLEVGDDRNIVVDPGTHHVTGIVDLSTAYWGDPFLSDVFYKPTASFAHGFGRLPNGDDDERLRQYMYVLYHTLLAIVRHGYRPAEHGAELEARRDLTTAMRQLQAIAATR
nr:hypothetical protein CFP56_19238 [Quercus suber]